jgi:hypothetical protein
LFFAFITMLLTGLIGQFGCANIIPPSGGPKDTVAPVLVTVTPGDTSKHFTANKIVFNFDEYIDPKDVRTELIVSPVPKVDPIVDAKLRTLTVRIKDTLQPNTTYSLNFGNAIRDVNEGNVLRGFTYVFSTGDHIDQGQLGGYVYVASTGKVDSTMVVMLHTKLLDDSAVVKEKPRYLTRVDSTGRFFFRYLQPGRYRLFAMKDEGGSHKYLSSSQLFAFADSSVIVTGNSPPQTLYAFSETPDVGGKSTTKSGSGSSGSSTQSAPKSTPKKSSKEKEKDKRLQVQTNAANNVFDVLDTFRLSFSTGLKTFDSTQIRFTDENFKDIQSKLYRFIRDTTNKKFALYFNWPTDNKYHLILPKGFAQDSAGRRLLKDDTISFRTKKDIEYGEVRIRVLNLDMSRKPVLQFVQSDAVKFAYPFNARREVRRILFPPGEYELRILYDANGNGVWDTGKFFGKQRRQPEKVKSIRKKVTVKANWDNDWDVTI